jgi:predicted RNA-binding Zn-ribbon protein involved in translation (DUF1610 family)
MSKWHDTTRCISCGYEITGLRRGSESEIQCPECGFRSVPEDERARKIYAIRRRDRIQIRALTLLGIIFVVAALLLCAYAANIVSL